ncbi:hypothetical protein BSR28_05465 [Boudabousia liubingyangii]|nr:hypothetical protein BSR28_05465 [Boudabousia liubingyangii]
MSTDRLSSAVADPQAMEGLRGLLQEYTETSLKELLSADAWEAWQLEIPMPARKELARLLVELPDKVVVLGALFAFRMAVPENLVRETLGETITLEKLVDWGLVKVQAGQVQSGFEMRPYDFSNEVDTEYVESGVAEFWFLTDWPSSQMGCPLEPNHVMGIGGATRSLLRITPRGFISRVLDIGTGCGVQAIVAARHADRVVATDISTRALQIAAFNAALNGVEIELRQGSMLEPVIEESFDLVVTNPPFVITPPSQEPVMEYRATGNEADQLMTTLISELPKVLAPGGQAVLLGNWLHLNEIPWDERLMGLVPTGIDALFWQREVYSPSQYAQMWLRDGGKVVSLDQQTTSQFIDYLDYFRHISVEAIGFGYITLRRPLHGRLGFQMSEQISQWAPPTAKQVQSWLQSVQFASDHGFLGEEGLTSEILTSDIVLVKNPEVVEVRYFDPGTEDPRILVLQSSWGHKIQVGQVFAGFFGACDGELTCAQICAALAEILEIRLESIRFELQSTLAATWFNGFFM